MEGAGDGGRGDESLEARRQALEEARLEVERGRLKTEEQRAKREGRLTWAIAVPLVGVIITGVIAVCLEESRQNQDFKLKAAEIIFNSPSPDQAEAKAIALNDVFPDDLDDGYARRFDAKRYEGGPNPTVVASLLTLLAEHPGWRQEIIETWKRAYPGDDWLPE
jgi:hypothetical protein